MQLNNILSILRITIRSRLYIAFTFLLPQSISQAQTNATIPTYHWAYEYIHQLRLRGYLSDLNTIQEPYIEKDVSLSLIQLQNKIQQGKIISTQKDKYLIDYLINDFQLKRQSNGLIYEAGIWADESILKDRDDTKFYTQLRSQVGVGLHENLYFYNGIRLDQSLLDDPIYAGKKWRGFVCYAEQAYLRYSNSNFRFSIGRDFLNWGSGKTGRLLFSDHAQPFDHLAAEFKYKGLQFTLLAAELDQWRLADSLVVKYGTQKANRYLSAHRLTISLKNKLSIGLTEALLYGGPNGNWELKYHNPLLYYHGELLNGGGSDGNGFLYLDFDWYPWRNWEFYGEFLVDDLQLEKTVTGDLEPDEIGMIFGFQHSDLFGLNGSLVGLEYVRIANRTYNSAKDWEKFVYLNRPIGYSLGNNFDRWNLTTKYWLMRGLQLGLVYDYIRKGPGSILDRWDTPWMSYTLAEGYHEPFPCGVVERSSIITLNLKYHFSANTMIASQVCYQNIENAFHEIGTNQNNWSLFFAFHWNWNTHFTY